MGILTLSRFLTLLACLGLSTEAQNRFIEMKGMSDGNLKVTEGRARLKVRRSRVRGLAAGFDCDPAAEGQRLIRSV